MIFSSFECYILQLKLSEELRALYVRFSARCCKSCMLLWFEIVIQRPPWFWRLGWDIVVFCPFILAGTHIVLTFINLTYSSNITADFFTGHKYITELTYWNIHQWAPTLKPDLALPTSCKTCHHVCHPLICKPPFSTVFELHTSCFTNYMPFRNCH